MKNTTPYESEEQELFCDYLKANNILFTSTQNGALLGGNNRYAQMRKLKATGTQAGFPDLILIIKNKSQTSDVLFIEMKRQKGGIISQEQRKWLHSLDKAGYSVGVAKGCESAIRILNKYLES